MDQKYLTDSESLSLNIEATCLLHSPPRNFPYEIKMDKYRPYPSMISMFTSDSQHPPRSRHAVHLGVFAKIKFPWKGVRALRGYFAPPPHEVKKWKLLFTSFFLLVYKNNSQSVKVLYWFDFNGCYGNKNGRQNRLKIGKLQFWSKFETCYREINIEHKHIPKKYYNRWLDLS